MRSQEKAWLGGLLAVGLLILGFALFGEHGWHEVQQLRRDRQVLLADIERLQRQRDVLRREVRSLTENPRAVETRAREDLGMIKEGETVFLLPERHAPER